jgi:hypothetical protein
MWFLAFFVVPPLFALFGLRYLRDRGLRVLVGAFFLSSLAVVAVLQIGGQAIGILPRLVYPSFIGVYLPAALALNAISERGRGVGPRGGRWRLAGAGVVMRGLGVAMPWIVMAVMAVLVNIDMVGYPTLYVEYFVNTPPAFLP